MAAAARNLPAAKLPIKPEMDGRSQAKAEAQIGAFAIKARGRIEKALRALPEVELSINSTKAEDRLRLIRNQIAQLGDKRIGIDIDSGKFESEAARLRGQLAELSRDKTASIQVKTDAAAAMAALTAVGQQARRLDSDRVNIAVNANDVNRAIGLVGLLTAALAGVSAAGAPALAVLGAIPALGGVAVQGIGAMATGFSGVSDAVKALSKAETDAAIGTGTAAKARVSATDRIASATRSLEQAQTSADRAAITGSQQVEDARRARDTAIEAGLARVTSAEQAYTRTQERARDAQIDLNRARQEAAEQLQQLSFSLEGAGIAQERAALRLIEARNALEEARVNAALPMDDPNRQVVDDLAYENLKLNVREAELAVKETADRFGDLKAESAEAARTGVEGTERVVAAKRAAVDATRDEREAEAELRQARTDALRENEQARRQYERAVQQAAWAEADAARQVTEAQIQLQQAMRDTGDTGSAAMDGVAEAMLNLSPAGQSFARMLAGEVLPALRGVRGEVQASLLPRMETSLRNLIKLAPMFSGHLADTGRIIGDLSVRGSEMMTSGPWRSDFGTILSTNNRILDDFGTAGLSVADMMRSVTVTSQPMVERFSQATQRGAEMANQWIQTKRATGELDEFFSNAGDTLAEFADVALQVVTGVINLANALGPLGMIVLHTVGAVAELVGNFAQAHPTITQVVATGFLAVAMFVKLGSAVGGLSKLLPTVIGGWQTLAGVVAAFGPAAVEARMARWTGLVDAQGVATDRAATKTGRFLSVAGQVSSVVPVLTAALGGAWLAWDAIVVSSGEAATALNKGGVEAAAARDRIGALEAGTTGLLGVLRPFITTQDEATAAAKRQRDEMGPLARAQSEAEQAAADHQLVLKTFSPVSEEGRASAQRLAEAQDALEREQQGAANATKSHTDRILEQQGVMQGALGSDLAYREALEAVNVQLRELAGISQLSTEQSLQLESSILRAAEASKQRELANYADKTSQEAVTAAGQAFNLTLLELITKAGTQAPAALQAYIGKLSESQLKAIGARIETDNLGNRVAVLPGGKTINITTTAPIAQAQVESLHRALDALPKNTSTRVVLEPLVKAATGQYRAPPPNFPGMIPGGYATGGPIRGPGTGTSDSILLRASDDEHMWSAAEVAGAGGHGRVERLRALALAGQLPAFATGGPIISGGVARRTFTSSAPAVTADLGITDPTAAAKAFELVSDVLTGQFTPALQAAQQAAGVDTTLALQTLIAQVPILTQATTDSGATMQATWAGNTASVIAAQQQQTGQFGILRTNLGNATLGMTQSIAGLQQASNASWANMQAVTQGSVGFITGPVFGGLHAGMDWVGQHAAAMRGGWAHELGLLQPAAANPIRWIMQFPLGPPGLAASWNTLDAQFKLGKRINPPAPGFATGGPIQGPGTGTSDSVMIRASDGEFMVREEVASRVPHFLKALNAGQAEAIQAAGGSGARMPGFALGGLIAVRDFAQRNQGRRYLWGGTGPRGWDCSGWVGTLASVARGENPYKRIGTTGNFPWAGFLPGLRGSFSAGAFKGNPGHMAATIGGVNAEAGGSHNTNAWGGPAVGADSPQFNIKAFLPEIGGVFASGGAGGGAGFDPTPAVNAAFAKAYQLLADVTRFFGTSSHVTGSQGVGRQAIDAVKGKALEQLSAMFAAGGLGPLGAGAPFYVGEISRAAKVRGLGVDGATIGTATSLVETNLRNLANRAVLASLNFPNDGLGGDHDSVGLFQQRQAGWGTVAQRMNPFASAGMFFDRLKAFDWRRMEPGAAAQRVQRSAYPGKYSTRMGQASGLVRQFGGIFDEGGWLPPGYSTVYNGTTDREVAAVFNRQQWRELASVGEGGRGDGPLIGSITQHITPGASADQIIGSAMFEARRARNKGRYR